MEKIKFGIQLTALMLAFPVWFMVEMKDADLAMKKDRMVIEQPAPAKNNEAAEAGKKQTTVSEFRGMPVPELVEADI